MNTKKALVADDEKCIRDMVQIMLEKCGYHVDSASNFDEAVELLTKAIEYDVIVSDNDMPEEDAGLELLRWLKGLGFKGRFILHTGGGRGEVEVEELGASYLPKPSRYADLKLLLPS